MDALTTRMAAYEGRVMKTTAPALLPITSSLTNPCSSHGRVISHWQAQGGSKDRLIQITDKPPVPDTDKAKTDKPPAPAVTVQTTRKGWSPRRAFTRD